MPIPIKPRPTDVKTLTIAAHRGLSGLSPESTEPAFKAAGIAGRRLPNFYLEADVQRTNDGQLVVIHDTNLKRTTDIKSRFPKERGSDIGAFSLEELQQLDAGTWFNEKNEELARESFEGLKILTFGEYLDICAHYNAGAYFEAKSPELYPGIEQDIVAALQDHGWLSADNTPVEGRDIYFQSFDADSLTRFRELAPEVPRVFLVAGQRWKSALDIADDVGAKVIAPASFATTPLRVRSAHKRRANPEDRLEVHPYQLDSKFWMRVHRYMGVDGWFTNRTDVTATLLTGRAINPDDLFDEARFK